jgi:preprotein translocase subunit SecA
MISRTLGKIFGTKNDREVKRLLPLVAQVNALEPEIQKLSDQELVQKTADFKAQVQNGRTLDDLLPEAFAVCREASKRILGMRHYDVQLIGGIALHRGTISEMRTGEGKTLVATLPTYLNALSGKGVHVVTVNDYLAKRDAEWMGRLYKGLGLSVGIIVHELNDRQRKQSYGSDITYGTNNEFGFDYLRDNMKFDLGDYVQRGHNFAIVDECDSILVDEARTPLIISGPAEESTDKYMVVDRIIPHLKRDEHFIMEEKSKTASLTEDGNSKVEQLLGIENLYDPQHIDILHHIYQALKAHNLYKRDVDYMVKDDEILIVDEFTGRLMPGRRWSDGLHQAIEAKERVRVKNENQTLASITFQNYFRMYSKLAGMTGTADTEAVEFKKIYNLDVLVIPTNKPMIRKDEEDLVYKTEIDKFKAIVEDIRERNKIGQPILVGTVSIEKSERLGDFLTKAGVRHNVLNAKHHQREAEIIAQAGRKGSVTIATNMAGRGTDILLGGNPEFMARTVSPDETTEEFKTAFAGFKKACEAERSQVTEAGGLYIIGTERHESRRIDNQLRGRAGRQGDPGASRFYLSLEDNLMRIFNGERIQAIMNRLNVPDDEPIVAPMVSRAVEGAQRKVEGHNFDIRKHLIEYDDVMNKQRNSIYSLRKEVLEGSKIDDIIREFLSDVTSHLLDTYADPNQKRENWDFDGMNTALNQQFGFQLNFEDGPLNKMSINEEKLTSAVSNKVKELFELQKSTLGPLFGRIEKEILLMTIDSKWKEHLQRVDHLKEGINLRAYAQKDPLVEYKKEAFNAFAEMNMAVKAETIEKVFKVQLVANPNFAQDQIEADDGNAIPEAAPVEISKPIMNRPRQTQMTMTHGEYNALDVGGSPSTSSSSMRRQNPGANKTAEPVVRFEEKVGRNDPCPCGSGKKFKKCHGVSLGDN